MLMNEGTYMTKRIKTQSKYIVIWEHVKGKNDINIISSIGKHVKQDSQTSFSGVHVGSNTLENS
jgi:hypothetical protein